MSVRVYKCQGPDDCDLGCGVPYVLEGDYTRLEDIVRRVAALDLGPKGYCSGSLFKLREDAMSALASKIKGEQDV